MFRELNINNVVEAADNSPFDVVAHLSALIDNDDCTVPEQVVSEANILAAQNLQAYFANTHSYLMGLWGVMRVKAGTDKNRIAVRDVLEGLTASCKLKYAAASRVLTGYQEIARDSGMGARTL